MCSGLISTLMDKCLRKQYGCMNNDDDDDRDEFNCLESGTVPLLCGIGSRFTLTLYLVNSNRRWMIIHFCKLTDYAV